jgi:predicted pyridoxine 5'-phosphate oxidase superfamily flavin-nucleotide-binding protein
MREPSPFHPGEQALQARAGRRASSERAGRLMILDFMPEEHRKFFASLPLVFVGSLDAEGRPWASLLQGAPGFLSSPDAKTLRVAAWPDAHDPLSRNLSLGAPLGLLGLEFHTRRRNRLNGTVARLDGRGFDLRADQSFGNCPKYIHPRTPLRAVPDSPGAVHAESALLSREAAALVESADTFFIASAAPGARAGDPTQGADISHRGGPTGFVRLRTERGRSVLTAPDYAGNSLFNTFGNLALEPRAGLLFLDFSTGHVLQLAGRTEVLWEGTELAAHPGARRLLRFEVDAGLWREHACPLRWATPA